MWKSSLCDYSDEYILKGRAITITGVVNNTQESHGDNRDKELISRNFSPFTDWIREKNISQINNAKFLDIVMPMHNLIEYSENY